MNDTVLSVSDFVGLLNRTLEYAYPSVVIIGELSNLRVSKGRWVYFDLKDDYSSVKFFGTVHQLPGPLEDGMMLQVRGLPRLHNQFGFSVNVQFMQPVGEGSLRKAAELLEAKLIAEGLFDPSRKRILPYPPTRIGLITSGESAAYYDFIKIMNERWSGVEIELADVQVQGERAPGQIIAAIDCFNSHAEPVDALVITRGGGSADDLAAFSTEQVTRAVAGSRIPTLVAIGHEVDISLAELAADQRASTPSNAAQLLVPDKKDVQQNLHSARLQLARALEGQLQTIQLQIQQTTITLHEVIERYLRDTKYDLERRTQLLKALSPTEAMKRGYAILRSQGKVIKSVKGLKKGDAISLQLQDGSAEASISSVS
jgi:exodeoxyribonuclease VII large subunit